MSYRVSVMRLDGNPVNANSFIDGRTPKPGELVRVTCGHVVVNAIVEDVHKMGSVEWVIAKEAE